MIRVAKLKIIGCDGDWRETRRELAALADDVKRATNLIWRTWMEWHSKAGSGPLLGDFMRRLREWHGLPKAERGEKPKCKVAAIDKSCSKAIYSAVHAAFPGVHNRVLELTRQVATKHIKSYKPYKGSFPGWMRVLVNDDRPAFSSHALPIRVDKANSGVVKDGKKWYLQARIQRLSDGKSVAHRFLLAADTRRAAGERSKLEKIVAGDYAFKGSMVDYNEKDSYWYAKVCYEQPALPKIDADPERVAHLIPHRMRPWVLWDDGFDHHLGGKSGRHVQHARQQLLAQKWGRQEAYKVASSARKGRGRKRGYEAAMNTLRRRWQDFVKTQNEAVVVEVLQRCQRYRIGRVVYYQPCDTTAENRFLVTGGKKKGRQDSSTWDWYQMGSILSRKCQEIGVEVEVVKAGQGLFCGQNGRKGKRDKEL